MALPPTYLVIASISECPDYYRWVRREVAKKIGKSDPARRSRNQDGERLVVDRWSFVVNGQQSMTYGQRKHRGFVLDSENQPLLLFESPQKTAKYWS
jgi:hypothetical protein